MSKKPKRILFLLILLTLPLLTGFGWWWSQIPGETLASFIEALKKGDEEKVNSLLSAQFNYEQEGEKSGFIGFKEKSPKRKQKVWQKALEKELKYSERGFTDFLLGRVEAQLKVKSTVHVNWLRAMPTPRNKFNKNLEPKTLILTIRAVGNQIELEQKLEEPQTMTIVTWDETSWFSHARDFSSS